MPAPKPAPLQLMVRRLAPCVASGAIEYSEALDTLVLEAFERGLCETPARLLAIEEWLGKILAREASR